MHDIGRKIQVVTFIKKIQVETRRGLPNAKSSFCKTFTNKKEKKNLHRDRSYYYTIRSNSETTHPQSTKATASAAQHVVDFVGWCCFG